MDAKHRGVIIRGVTDKKIPSPFDRGEFRQHGA